jgi:hypothetical protein
MALNNARKILGKTFEHLQPDGCCRGISTRRHLTFHPPSPDVWHSNTSYIGQLQEQCEVASIVMHIHVCASLRCRRLRPFDSLPRRRLKGHQDRCYVFAMRAAAAAHRQERAAKFDYSPLQTGVSFHLCRCLFTERL